MSGEQINLITNREELDEALVRAVTTREIASVVFMISVHAADLMTIDTYKRICKLLKKAPDSHSNLSWWHNALARFMGYSGLHELLTFGEKVQFVPFLRSRQFDNKDERGDKTLAAGMPDPSYFDVLFNEHIANQQ